MRKYIPKPLPTYKECKGCQAHYCCYSDKIHKHCPCKQCLVKPSCKEACKELRNVVHESSTYISPFMFVNKEDMRHR